MNQVLSLLRDTSTDSMGSGARDHLARSNSKEMERHHTKKTAIQHADQVCTSTTSIDPTGRSRLQFEPNDQEAGIVNVMQGPASFGKRPLAVQALWQTLRTKGEPGTPSLGQRAKVFPGMVRDTLNGTYLGMSRGRLGGLALVGAYIASPFDAIPEFVLLVFGMGDDAVAGTYLAGALIVETDRYLTWREVATKPVNERDAT